MPSGLTCLYCFHLSSCGLLVKDTFKSLKWTTELKQEHFHENSESLKTWMKLLRWFTTFIPKYRSIQRPSPHLSCSKKRCTLTKEQSTEIPHAPTSPAGHTRLNLHVSNTLWPHVQCSDVVIRGSKQMKSPPWSKLSTGFISRVSHPGKR